KFEAATAAFWSGGAFVYVPAGVVVEQPLQIVYAIDEPGTAQYAHTLAIGGANADFRLREYDLAPDFEGQALHAGAFELYLWKGASTGSSRASYEGLIKIEKDAQESHTYLQTHSMMLSPKARVDAIPSLIVETDSVSASHGGTVGEVDEDQVFYMRTRGLSRREAIRVIVEGYFEPIIVQLDDAAPE